MRTATLLTLGLLALSLGAQADEHGSRLPVLPKYQQECASCHMAYPPSMLPAASWQRIMAGLGKHYGSDASLEAVDLRAISVWLQANAGTYKRVKEEPPQDRITRSAWFERKHDAREVPPDAWKRATVGSPANCAACHPNAEQGRFSEREIRIPR